MRFVIVGYRRNRPQACHYVSRGGNLTTNGERAAVIRGFAQAQHEAAYWTAHYTDYSFDIERLPPRVPLAKALLRGVPVDCRTGKNSG